MVAEMSDALAILPHSDGFEVFHALSAPDPRQYVVFLARGSGGMSIAIGWPTASAGE